MPALVACGEGPPLEPPAQQVPDEVLGARLTCLADVVAGRLDCEPASAVADGMSAVIIGGQHRYVRLTSTNVASSGGVLSADVTVQNLTLQPFATTDGTTPDPAGVRVFFETGPTNGVTVANPDGAGTFTATNQPYHEYGESPSRLGGDGILSSSTAEISAAKVWQFGLNGATTFSFSVYVSAAVPDASGLAVSLSAVASWGGHTCGISSTGAYCWGENNWGQVGDGTVTIRTTPRPVVEPPGVGFARIGAGAQFTCAVSDGGSGYCWGYNGEGQLGDGTTTGRTTPVAVQQPTGTAFTDLEVGFHHTCALTSVGSAYCWGENNGSQLGDGTTTNRSTPVAVAGGPTFVQLAAGAYHSCGLTAAGQTYCWGTNQYGQVGDGTTTTRATPVQVAQPSGVTFTELTAGSHHSCALTSEGQAYCWGINESGRLGDGTTTTRTSPTPVSQPTGVTFTSLAAGGQHSCGVDAAGQAYCWGRNFYGQLGNGSTNNSLTAVPVDQSDGMSFYAIEAASQYTCALASAGPAYCWGSNAATLGDGTFTPRTTPVPVASTR